MFEKEPLPCRSQGSGQKQQRGSSEPDTHHTRIYTHICTHTHTYTRTYTHAHVHNTQIYIYTHSYTLVIYTHIYTYTDIQIHIPTHVYIYIHIYICTFTYTHTQTYTETHTHIYTHPHTHTSIHIDTHILAHRPGDQKQIWDLKATGPAPSTASHWGGRGPIFWSGDLEELKVPLLSPSSNHRL